MDPAVKKRELSTTLHGEEFFKPATKIYGFPLFYKE
jgi:hypothetical protein